MLKKGYKEKQCSLCPKVGKWMGKKCPFCSQKQWNKRRREKVKKETPRGDFKNQTELFEHIWKTRPHVSEVNGEPLGNEAKAIFFSHILPKGTYPQYKLNPENVILKTEQQHIDWHSKSPLDLQKEDPNWVKVFAKKIMLQKKYPN